MEESKVKKSKPMGFGGYDEVEEIIAKEAEELSPTPTPELAQEEEEEQESTATPNEEPSGKRHHTLVRPMSRRKQVPVRGQKNATNFRV